MSGGFQRNHRRTRLRDSRRGPARFWPLALLLATVACGREEVGEGVGDEASATKQPILVETVTVPTGVQWLATNIVMRPGQVVEISGTAAVPATNNSGVAVFIPPLGDPEPDPLAPLPLFGRDGLIARVGETGFPFAVPGIYRVQGSSLSDGQRLFLGRNVAADSTAWVGITAPTSTTDQTIAANIVASTYTPRDYTVTLSVFATDAPALLTPVDGFFANNANPVFDWDDIDNASQFTLDISDFPDFRRITFSVNVASTSLNTTTLVDPNNPTQPITPNLGEGVWYWRVRAQVNTGRLLTPTFTWTERSVPFMLGVETEADTLPVDILTPTQPSGSLVVPAGTTLPFEILAEPDASGLTWRYRFFRSGCGDLISPTDTTIAHTGSNWRVFQQRFQTNRIDVPERLYAGFVSPVLTEGEWLLRVETRDGADTAGTRIGVRDYRLTAGCQ